MEIHKYLFQYTTLEVNSTQNEVSNNWAYALYYAQLLDTSSEALLLGCDTVHVQHGRCWPPTTNLLQKYLILYQSMDVGEFKRWYV